VGEVIMHPLAGSASRAGESEISSGLDSMQIPGKRAMGDITVRFRLYPRSYSTRFRARMFNLLTRVAPVVVVLFVLNLTGALLTASSIRQVSLDEMIGGSELIFKGKVIGSEAFVATGLIQTAVVFEIQEIIKGVYPEGRIRLTFLGGTVGSRSLKVSDMRMPSVGERGIYFVESVTERQVNPLYGWHQGHFLILIGPDGKERVTTVRGFPITQLSLSLSPHEEATEGVALGVRRSGMKNAKGVSAREFIKDLRELMRGLK
jgi:hypothetical protein